jgi:hypothetical protein
VASRSSAADPIITMRFEDALLRETRVFESVDDAMAAHRQGRSRAEGPAQS